MSFDPRVSDSHAADGEPPREVNLQSSGVRAPRSRQRHGTLRVAVGSGLAAALLAWTSALATTPLTGSNDAAFKAHLGQVASLAFAGNGSVIVSGGVDSGVKLWDAATGRKLRTLRDYHAWTTTVAFSPDGLWVATGGRGPLISIWGVESHNLRRTIVGTADNVTKLRFSPEGRYLIVGGDDGSILLWEVDSGKATQLPAHQEAINSLSLSRSGEYLASSSEDRTVRLWNLNELRSIRTLGPFEGRVDSVAFSPREDILATAHCEPPGRGRVRLWKANGKKAHRAALSHTLCVRSLAFSPDGATLATGGDEEAIRFWNRNDWRVRKTLFQSGARVTGLAFSPDGTTLYSMGTDLTIRLWNDSRLQKSLRFASRGYLTDLAVSPDGSSIVSSSWGAYSGGAIRLHGGRDGDWRGSLDAPTESIRSVSVSQDDALVATGGDDNIVRVWKAADGRLLRAFRMTLRGVASLVFSSDSKQLAAGAEGGQVTLWDIERGLSVWSTDTGESAIANLTILEDGNIGATSRDLDLMLLDGSTGTLLFKDSRSSSTGGASLAGADALVQALDGELQVVRFRAAPPTTSEDGGTISTAGYGAPSLILDDYPIDVAEAPPAEILSVALSDDGTRVAYSLSGREEITVQRTADGSTVARIQGAPGGSRALSFSSDGQQLAAGGADGTLRVWNGSYERHREFRDESTVKWVLGSTSLSPYRLDKARLGEINVVADLDCGGPDDGRCITQDGFVLFELEGSEIGGRTALDQRSDGVRVRHSRSIAEPGGSSVTSGSTVVVGIAGGIDLAAGDIFQVVGLAATGNRQIRGTDRRRSWRYSPRDEKWRIVNFQLPLYVHPFLEEPIQARARALPKHFGDFPDGAVPVAFPRKAGESIVSPPDPPRNDFSARPAGSDRPLTSPASERPAQDSNAAAVFRAEVQMVNVLCMVRDSKGRFVPNLTREDFEVKEDGVRQQILHFSHGSEKDALPLAVALLVDTSTSVEDKLEFEQQAAMEFLKSVLRPGRDAAAILQFATQVKLIEEFGFNLDHLEDSIFELYPHGRTTLFDGIWLSIEDVLKSRQGRRALVILSDGDDTYSEMNSFEALRAAHDSEVSIFGIGVRQHHDSSNFKQLKKFTKPTGGMFIDSKADVDRLRSAFERVRTAILNQYYIGYTPSNGLRDGRFRKLQVKVKRRGVKVTHRSGYFAD